MPTQSSTDEHAAPARQGPEVLLELDDVCAHVGSSRILHSVGFGVPAAQTTVLIGRNGVGKTSTLRSVLGLMERTGTITFAGHDLTALPTHRIARLGIAYVPENRDVFHGLTIEENLRLAERRGQVPHYDRVYELFPELQQRRRQAAGTLSGGQQQMVSLARALLHDYRLLLIDEPTKGLAPRLVTELVEVLERLAGRTTVVLVEQNLAVTRRLADHVVVLAEGRVARSGPVEQVLADSEELSRLLGVKTTGGRG
ncbi:ABC transporter ATP-binding protein [Amycolatopsis jejuensis]|uniref:ABC transporter ATP-binding protein n=1 Tax=Amycolatopsis jejuensis TaxID=330084 RepID=UPI00068D45D3|nr:ABC transporter ATP-binding protein [Amycolatopsis jejuensis]